MPIHNGKMQISHTVYYTVHAPEGSAPHPALIVLHGFGQHADEFSKVFESLPSRRILVAAPQAPHHFYPQFPRRNVGFSWLTRYERDQSIADFIGYMRQFVELLRNDYSADLTRLYVLGFSQGVSMAYRFWVHGAAPVRGVIACSSDLPPDVAERLNSASPTPVLLVHGRDDQIMPVTKSREAEVILRTHAIPVELIEFDGGHYVPSLAVERIAEMIASSG
ncbi:MAG: alpha/beta hydrolase [bacterium]